jgi:transcriptional regulator with GAF, ATPase, and Fis domain
LGAYSIPSETGLLIPSVFVNPPRRRAASLLSLEAKKKTAGENSQPFLSATTNLQAALRRIGGKKTAAAKLLRLDGQKMKYLCRKYGLNG